MQDNYLERIALALEELVEISKPKPIDMDALLAEATEALFKNNPGFRMAFELVEKQMTLLQNGDDPDAASRIGD